MRYRGEQFKRSTTRSVIVYVYYDSGSLTTDKKIIGGIHDWIKSASRRYRSRKYKQSDSASDRKDESCGSMCEYVRVCVCAGGWVVVALGVICVLVR